MITLKKIATTIASGALAIGVAQTAPAFADTLDDVKERGFLRCGASDFKSGFSIAGSNGGKG